MVDAGSSTARPRGKPISAISHCPRRKHFPMRAGMTKHAHKGRNQVAARVPAVTVGFWVVRILGTTLGETGGDTATMTLNWGYAAGVALFGFALLALVAAQILAKRFHATLYWAT